MRLGDIVSYGTGRWKVTKYFRDARVCELTNWAYETTEVPDDLDTIPNSELSALIVVASPVEDWPFATAQLRSTSTGPVRFVSRAGNELVPLIDWVPGDLYRPGGTLFFNPQLGLRTGQVLVAVHRDGTRSRVNLNRAFGTAKRRKAVAKAGPRKPRGPRNRYDRILGADPFEDDDEETSS